MDMASVVFRTFQRKFKIFQPYKCYADGCEKEFSKYGPYEHHLRFRHNIGENRTHRCTYDGCDKEYGAIDSLRTHVKRVHLGIMPEKKKLSYICEQCGRSFKNGFNLKVVWRMDKQLLNRTIDLVVFCRNIATRIRAYCLSPAPSVPKSSFPITSLKFTQ